MSCSASLPAIGTEELELRTCAAVGTYEGLELDCPVWVSW